MVESRRIKYNETVFNSCEVAVQRLSGSRFRSFVFSHFPSSLLNCFTCIWFMLEVTAHAIEYKSLNHGFWERPTDCVLSLSKF